MTSYLISICVHVAATSPHAAQSDDEEWDIGPILGVIFSLIFVFIILPIAIFILISICCIFGTATVAHYCCWRHSDRNVTTAVPATPEVVVLTSELPVVAYPASGYDHSKQVCVCACVCV